LLCLKLIGKKPGSTVKLKSTWMDTIFYCTLKYQLLTIFFSLSIALCKAREGIQENLKLYPFAQDFLYKESRRGPFKIPDLNSSFKVPASLNFASLDDASLDDASLGRSVPWT
jgi:hypothetical protein